MTDLSTSTTATTTSSASTNNSNNNNNSFLDIDELKAAIDAFSRDFASFLDQSHIVEPNVKHIESYTIENLLTRIDEFKRLVSLVAVDTSQAREFLPTLAKQAGELEHVFASIDAGSAVVERGMALAKELEDRVSKVERDLTTRSLDPRNVMSARRRATAMATGAGIGAPRDANGKLIITEGVLSQMSVFSRQKTTPTSTATESTTATTSTTSSN